MRRLASRILFAGSALLFAGTLHAQIGKSISVPAGTPEDKALSEIYAASDPAQKIALLDKFMSNYGKGDLELLADQLYTNTYLEQKDYGKTLQYGDKALALDPDNLAIALAMVRAADAAGDASKVFENGQRVQAIVTRYTAAPPPSGVSPETWAQQKAQNLKAAQADLGFVEYAMFSAAYKSPNAPARAALLERFVAAFPNSTYKENAQESAAFSYQQAQDFPKMLKTAQEVLAGNPSNVGMLLLLADYWSEGGKQLDDAEADAQKAIAVLAQAKKPEQLSDEQWRSQAALQTGLAYSALGEVYSYRSRWAPAIEQFKQANPLLKSSPTLYGRNLYRLGFALAKAQRTAEARSTLTEAVSIDSPYKQQAQKTLDALGGAVRRHHH